MVKINKYLILIIFLTLTPFSVFAHPGKTDAKGCHVCKSNCEKWSLEKDQNHCHISPIETKEVRTDARKNATVRTNDNKFYECGTKTFCTEMNSCEEAKYFYSFCGLLRLDGDKDGIPCESLCK